MTPRAIVISMLALSLVGCPKDASGPDDNLPTLDSATLSDITYSMVGFNTLRLTHRLGDQLHTTDVARVQFGVVRQLTFIPLDSSVAVNVSGSDQKVVTVASTLKLDSSRVSEVVRIRYWFVQGTSRDVDSTIETYTYPYPSARLVATMEVFQSFAGLPRYPQDVARLGDVLYVHPTAAHGLYAYNLLTAQSSYPVPYTSGDHIAADSIYVYCDISGRSVSRFNTLLNQVDLQIPNQSTNYIAGMTAARGRLFVRVSNGYMKQYSLDGVLIDSVYFPTPGIYLAQSNGLFFVLDDAPRPNTLTAYDASTLAIRARYVAPCWEANGIKVYRDTLYYCDHDRRAILALALSDLVSLP